MNRETALALVHESRLIPVLRAASAEQAIRAADALLEGGLTTIEITLTVPGALDAIAHLARRHCGSPRVLLGVGSVCSLEQAKAALDAGAEFVVSPGFDAEVVAHCRERRAIVAPGALTPTEVVVAKRAGADLIKIFPASAMGGASYIKALRAPLPDVALLPTGGVTLENIPEFFAAGAAAVGVGQNLADLDMMEREGAGALSALAERFVKACQLSGKPAVARSAAGNVGPSSAGGADDARGGVTHGPECAR